MVYGRETTCCFSPTLSHPKSQCRAAVNSPASLGKDIAAYCCLSFCVLQPWFQLLTLPIALTETAGNSGTVLMDYNYSRYIPRNASSPYRKTELLTPLLCKYGLIFMHKIPSSPQPPKLTIHFFLQTQFSLAALIS